MILIYDTIVRDESQDDAILIRFDNIPVWVPRNCILSIDENNHEVEILDWFCIEKSLEDYEND